MSSFSGIFQYSNKCKICKFGMFNIKGFHIENPSHFSLVNLNVPKNSSLFFLFMPQFAFYNFIAI